MADAAGGMLRAMPESFRSIVLCIGSSAALALGLGAAPTAAHEAAEARNRVSFQVERSREVPNDQVRAVVGVSAEDSDSARLADRVNETMAWALGVAKRAEGVEVRSGGYQTYPVHEKGAITRWRAQQDLQLESRDVAAVSELLGKLQSRLVLRGIEFGVSTEARRELEASLVAEALAAFRTRAEQVQKELGARDHELVSLSIHTPDAGGPPHPMLMRSAAAEGVTAPSFESGESTLSSRVDATIELEY